MDREEAKSNLWGAAAQGTAGGSLNPNWVEWLMGYPIGWTDLEGLGTPSSRKSLKKSGV